ncbi:SusC/RagA family TonB-linked outer membrane protein [Niabella pedocola]|uniref:SusC/RagA family TonB-linked outer membrane protein n=1 Tax=Niabella pedocola TaxID=1752077 RepID=A0ABS8PV07_9BACT|nr:SusC/RagA family TonB-linked outer membrane protein [Niabella pedocola]MCD2424906.1 SusC/RagA family TonB-linked outer membrane protein [Niabella pedocola]
MKFEVVNSLVSSGRGVAVRQFFRSKKTILSVKFSFILLTVACMQVAGRGVAQTVNITGRNITLEKVFSLIEHQTGYSFWYNAALVRKAKKVNLSLKDAPLNEALNACLKGQELSYRIVERVIIIRQQNEPPPQPVPTVPVVIGLRGIVKDEDGRPLESVTVKNLRTGKATVTGADGGFLIPAEVDDVIEFTFVGHAPERYKVTAGDNNIQVLMKIQSGELSEAVTVGYGTTQKKDLTGSVAVVKGKDIQDIPFITVDNALAGKAAGVQVAKSDGTPGGAVRVRVRGTTSMLGGNDPLYIIDGIPIQPQNNYMNPGFDVSNPVGNDVTGSGGVAAGMQAAFVNGLNGLGGINLNDIETISILKDASATAIYGSRAANGVIIITTKNGKKDMKPQVSFNYYTTYSKPIVAKVLNADQYKMLLIEGGKNAYAYLDSTGQNIPDELDAIVNHADSYFGKAHTDWVKLATRNTFSQNAEVSLQGGSAATTYYTSLAYTYMPGTQINTDYRQVTGNLKISSEIGKKFKFGTNLFLGSIDQDISNGVYGQALRARPDLAPYDSTGSYTSFQNIGYSYQGFQNPLALASSLNIGKTFRLLGSFNAAYELTKHLKWNGMVSLFMEHYNQQNYTPSYVSIGSFYGNVQNSGGIGSNSNMRKNNWTISNNLTYNNVFNNKHHLDVVAGTEYITTRTSFFSATATGFPNDDVLNNLSSATTPLITRADDPQKPQSYLLSFYMRANYTFRDKYLFTLTGRADGSSKFGTDDKWGYFPSGSVAWRLSQENFLRDVAWIDDIKLRASYGTVGTQNIGDQMYRTLYSPFMYGGSSALVPNQLGNPGIRWESTKESNLALDLGFFKNRLQATVEYYNRLTDGALLSLPVAPSSSYGSLLGNVVSFRNKGIEMNLQGDIIRSKDFRWNASLNATWGKSIVTKLRADANLGQIGNASGVESGNTTFIEGQPLGLITGLKVTGVIRNQAELDAYAAELGIWRDFIFPNLAIGDPMFVLDTLETIPGLGSGRYPAFNQVIGHGAPKCFGGFTQGFSYKNFDLNFYFTFSYGGQLMWGDHVSSINMVGTSNANVVRLERYYPGNTGAGLPRLYYDGQSLLYNTNLSVFNSSYLKLRTLMLNYRFNTVGWMQRAGVRALSVYASANNIFTATSYPGNDPETSNDPYSVGGGYFDISNYPTTRSFAAGVKLGF